MAKYCLQYWETIKELFHTNTEYSDQVIGIEKVIRDLVDKRELLQEEGADPEAVEWIVHCCYTYWARLVLDKRWLDVDDDTKCRLMAMLAVSSKRLPSNESIWLARASILACNPWGEPTLQQMMMLDQKQVDLQKAIQYIAESDDYILKIRVEILIFDGCYKYAWNLVNWLMKLYKFKSSDYFQKIHSLLYLRLCDDEKIEQFTTCNKEDKDTPGSHASSTCIYTPGLIKPPTFIYKPETTASTSSVNDLNIDKEICNSLTDWKEDVDSSGLDHMFADISISPADLEVESSTNAESSIQNSIIESNNVKNHSIIVDSLQPKYKDRITDDSLHSEDVNAEPTLTKEEQLPTKDSNTSCSDEHLSAESTPNDSYRDLRMMDSGIYSDKETTQIDSDVDHHDEHITLPLEECEMIDGSGNIDDQLPQTTGIKNVTSHVEECYENKPSSNSKDNIALICPIMKDNGVNTGESNMIEVSTRGENLPITSFDEQPQSVQSPDIPCMTGITDDKRSKSPKNDEVNLDRSITAVKSGSLMNHVTDDKTGFLMSDDAEVYQNRIGRKTDPPGNDANKTTSPMNDVSDVDVNVDATAEKPGSSMNAVSILDLDVTADKTGSSMNDVSNVDAIITADKTGSSMNDVSHVDLDVTSDKTGSSMND
ncbi:unnamed protein product, partial [Owenia fusiformis]